MTDRPHWMEEALRRARLPGSETLRIAGNTPLVSAWQEAIAQLKLPPRRIAEAVAQRFRLEVADLRAADPSAIRLVPEQLARTHHVCPVHEDYRKVTVATADPTDIRAEQAIQFASGRSVVFQVAPPAAVEEAILFFYSPDQATARVLGGLEAGGGLEESIRLVEEEVVEERHSEEVLGSGPVVRLTDIILREAVRLGASDIHIQPTAHGAVIRYRVDGVLRNAGTLPMGSVSRIAARIKVMGRLDIADRLRPQDGRARIQVGNRSIDLRISTVPTRKAEKVVIRLLDPGSAKSLEEIGFPPAELAAFRALLDHRDGVVVVTGPTGSGKTTTLYAALREVAQEGVNVMTVEDPVEYDLPGLTQIQVETKQGVTFASALRAILRQDPDVIFVGEIRDPETATVAVQAALTGHLVLATLHTNDAVGTIRRLQDLGLDASAINEGFRGAVAQRLVRRLCGECAEPIEGRPTAREEELANRYGIAARVRSVGCESCGQTGFRGRIPVIQIMAMSPALRTLVERGATPDRFEGAARSGGMRSLGEAASHLLLDGTTTLEEVDRVLGESSGLREQDEEGVPDGAIPDHGTPLPAPPLPPEARPAPDGGSPDGGSPGAPASTEAPPHILLVDDDGTTRIMARALLERDGYRVSEVSDGVEALEFLSRGAAVDLLVLDLSMPRMDGETLLQRLRQDPGRVELPVVVLTSAQDQASEVRLVEAGADDYVRKPFHPKLFLNRLEAALRRAQAVKG